MIDSLFVCLPVVVVTDTHPSVLDFDWFTCGDNANCFRDGHGYLNSRNCADVFIEILFVALNFGLPERVLL